MLLTDEEKQLIFANVSQALQQKRFISAQAHIQELVQEKLSNDEAENLDLLKDFIKFAREKHNRLVILGSIFALNKYITKSDDANSDSIKFIVNCAHAIWGENIFDAHSNPKKLLLIVSEKIDYPYGVALEADKSPRLRNSG